MIWFLNAIISILRRIGLLPSLTIMVLTKDFGLPPPNPVAPEPHLPDTLRPPAMLRQDAITELSVHETVNQRFNDELPGYYGLLHISGTHRIELEDE